MDFAGLRPSTGHLVGRPLLLLGDPVGAGVTLDWVPLLPTLISFGA